MVKSNRFINGIKNADAETSVSVTENGALGFSKTNSRLVDFFFHIGSMRSWDKSKIASDFAEAYAENPQRAIETMFLARDCRGGMGEKNVFNVCFDWLVRNYPGDAKDVLHLIPEYGSWKTFFDLTDSFQKNADILNEAKDVFKKQLAKDMSDSINFGKCSLLAKWCPSENTSSKETRKLANYWRNVLGLSGKEYRKMLSGFRRQIKIVETSMSANKWSEIDYNAVPAKAGLLYKDAFLKHDELRRKEWLSALSQNNGSAKINTSGLTAADLVKKYMESTMTSFGFNFDSMVEDPVIEAAWKDLIAKNQLPENCPDMIPVMDGSGSMYWDGNNAMKAIYVSIGLGLFLANINRGAFKGKAIEFGRKPHFFEVPTGASLFEQIKIAMKYDDCGNTNIRAVMELVLKTAVDNNLGQNEIPQLICFSDMEFDEAFVHSDEKLFKIINDEYNAAGYLLPKMFFWNIDSRSNTIPLIENEMGVGLLSGYSQSIMDMVLSRKLNPYSILIEKLNSPRYDLVRKALGIIRPTA